MINKIIKYSIRVILRNKIESIINIIGLAIGIACSIMIFLWVQDELSFDRFHENSDNLFRLITVDSTGNRDFSETSSWRLGPALKDEYSEIIDFARICTWWNGLVKVEDKSFMEDRIYLSDPSFFTMFSFPIIKGNPEKVLEKINDIAISESTAKRYFGDENPIGKSVLFEQTNIAYTISGVFKDAPANSVLQFDIVARIELMGEQIMNSWEYVDQSYVQLQENVKPEDLNKKISGFYLTVWDNTTNQPQLQPLKEVHLNKNAVTYGYRNVLMFIAIALVIMLIACINYMNLSTARAEKRTVEIGIKKVIGASRSHLIKQFFSETITIAFISHIIAMFLVEAFLPGFNRLSGKSISIDYSNIYFLSTLVSIIIFTALIAGSYPAIYLSSLSPMRVIRIRALNTSRRFSFRIVLVIVQFTTSIILIITTLVIVKQMDFVMNKDQGYNKEDVLYFRFNETLKEKYDTYRNELLRNPDIINVSAGSHLPGNVGQNVSINWEGNETGSPLGVHYILVEPQYIETFEMQILNGRSFSEEFSNDDSIAYIVNETAIKQMGLENPIGKKIRLIHPGFDQNLAEGVIIGVVKDFHFRLLYQNISPFLLRIYRPWEDQLFVKISPQNTASTIESIKEITTKFSPDYPWNYEFGEDTSKSWYKDENKMESVLRLFAFFAILISCLGLYGLVSFATLQRTKEIGIRKTNGASSKWIIIMLWKDFTKWVILSIIIATPIAWYITNNWIQNFVYQTSNLWWTFIIASFIALLMALLTTCWHVIKAANVNPANSLRCE
ncbi:ABC transporter permease [Bacteroidota bacterium]